MLKAQESFKVKITSANPAQQECLGEEIPTSPESLR